jgi:hypothetical protein
MLDRVLRLIVTLTTLLMTGVFFVGLGVRVHHSLTGRGGRAGREHEARKRQVRLSVRRPAEGVPATGVPALTEDPDSAISMGEG